MKHTVLIIDDIQIQAENLEKVFKKERPDYNIKIAYTEEEILKSIENFYFNVAIVDLRMDNFSINGFDIIKQIVELNPFAKIIIQSAFIPEYTEDLKDILSTGKIVDIVDKSKFDVFKEKIIEKTDVIVKEFEETPNVNIKALETIYSEAKNEQDTFIKGKKFEQFISIIFSQMGFNHILERIIDRSLNEVDLIVRNEIKDEFFTKFKPYFLIECKNHSDRIGKNDFIQFYSKLENTNGLSNLGILFTSSSISKNTYIEAVRTSRSTSKIVFISNKEIKRLIYSKDLLTEFKSIIDEQVKDN